MESLTENAGNIFGVTLPRRPRGVGSLCLYGRTMCPVYLRCRILLRMRRFLRPTLRRPLPRRFVAMLHLSDSEPATPNFAEQIV